MGPVVPVVGLEPTRMISPTDFESVTSANSITPANLLRFSAFFRFLEIGGHGGGQKSNFSIFGCQKIPKSGDFRSSERQTEKDFLSPSRLPIPSHRQKALDCRPFSAFWKSEVTVEAKSLIFRFSVVKKSLNLGISGVLNGKQSKIF